MMKLADKIEHINENDVLNAGREKINKFAIDPAMRAESNSVDAKNIANKSNEISNSAKDIAKNTDNRLDNIVANEMQDAEVIDARRPFGMESYETLSKRIDNQIGKNDEFRSFDVDSSYMKRVFNESAERGINVKWFGAIGDGVTDDTQAFIDAIAYSHRIAVETGLIKNYPVVVPSGIYLLNPRESIRLTTFTRLLGIGKPIIKTDFEGSLFWVCPLGTDPDFSGYMNMQQYTNAPLLENLHFTKKTRGTDGSKTGTALEFGERENVLSWRYATSRYLVRNVSIEYFGIGMKWGIYNHYLASYENCHFEGNDTHVQIGGNGSTFDNSGENMRFTNTVFGNGLKAIDWKNGGMDINFIQCSFDFVKKVFTGSGSSRKVCISNSHIERNDVIVDEFINSDIDAPTQFIFIGCTINLHGGYEDNVLFKGNSIVTLMSCRSEKVTCNKNNLYIADTSVQFMSRDFVANQTWRPTMMSRNLNLVPGIPFSSDSTNFFALSDTLVSTSFTTTNIPENKYTHAIVVKGADNSTISGTTRNVKAVLKNKIPVSPGDRLVFGTMVYSKDSLVKNQPNELTLNITPVFYKSSDDSGSIYNTLNTLNAPFAPSDHVNKWFPAMTPTVIVPQGTAYLGLEIYIAMSNKTKTSDIYIGEICINKI